jgi:hypothetical protein
MREWINQRFATNFSEEDLSSIKDFALIWNVFESHVCNTNYSIQAVRQRIIARAMNAADFNNELQYFRQRYLNNGNFNQRFPHLNFRSAAQKTLVENVLVGTNTNNNDIIVALIYIVHRYRNNLFHGIKDMQHINQQRDNFNLANKLLQKFLDH